VEADEDTRKMRQRGSANTLQQLPVYFPRDLEAGNLQKRKNNVKREKWVGGTTLTNKISSGNEGFLKDEVG